MKAYELLYFVDPTANEETRAGAMKRIDVAITGEGGTIDSVEDWASASSPSRSTTSRRVTTPSSTSTQIPPRSPSSTEFCASTTPLSVT